MLKERLQILVTKEQRDRLKVESRTRGVSVGELVRKAIDKEYAGPTREEKLRAWEEIKAMRGGPAPSPEELNRIVEDGIDERFRRAGIDIPRRD
ncbi:MAG: antitoxin [Solirubrobacterales bacterium]